MFTQLTKFDINNDTCENLAGSCITQNEARAHFASRHHYFEYFAENCSTYCSVIFNLGKFLSFIYEYQSFRVETTLLKIIFKEQVKLSFRIRDYTCLHKSGM